MKVAKDWLKQLVEVKDIEEVERLLPLRTINTKEVTPEFIELDMKGYNRADLLSLRGVAYEVAAITNSQVKFTESDVDLLSQKLPEITVKIENPELCPVYCVAKIEGLRVGPSDQDWIKKLTDSGIRSINNVADVTNLVMLEYGQPLHSFDAKAVKDETIVVRTAKKGERITTLDGKTRDLENKDLLIADPQNNLGIAGVMGGKDSEVIDTTHTILLEAAIFDPKTLRKTSQRLGLVSEASKRFYHGLTKKRLLQALDAAIRMYQELGGKLTALTIVGNTTDQLKEVPLTLERTDSLIGVDLKKEQIEESLEKLNFSVRHSGLDPESTNSGIPKQVRDDGTKWEVTPPYFRLDIDIEEDLIEEVARMYGYENIPAKELPGNPPATIDQKLFELIYNLKITLADLGLTEVQTYSFFSTAVLQNLNLNKDQLVKVTNPISSETEYLRNHLWPNLIEVIDKNKRADYEDIAIFEIGKIYYSTKDGAINEEYRLSIALLNGTDNPTSELYQILLNMVKQLKLDISAGEAIGESAQRFHPTRYIYLTFNNQPIGKIGEVHSRITDKFGINKRVAVLEISIVPLLHQ